jgi:glycosyltransferase involved in cell wall biosynthesis
MSMRGGEKVIQAIAEFVPDAPIYTLLADVDALSPQLQSRDIRPSFLQRIPGAKKNHRQLLPLYPAAARRLDLTAFDVVISSDAAICKGIRTRPDALHICYCHSPMRYVWDLYDEYKRRAGIFRAAALTAVAGRLRRFDHQAAQTVTAFIANSNHVADRIHRNYQRQAATIYPPVQGIAPTTSPAEEFYLSIGELVEYKRADLAVEACTKMNRRLVVIGDGPMLKSLRDRAPRHVQFLGWQNDDVVHDHMRSCKALLFCGEEDFGMVPVEVQAAGRPVIALAKGGALETVISDKTGMFFNQPTVDDLIQTIKRFESSDVDFSPAAISEHARQFSPQAFDRRFTEFVTRCVEQHDPNHPRPLDEMFPAVSES